MSASSPSPSGASALLAGPPSNRAGIIAASIALALMLIGAIVIPQLLPVPTGDPLAESPELTASARAALLGNALAVLGYLPLLTAVHALIGVRARPSWAMLTAYLVLLLLPLAIVVEAITYPDSVLVSIGPLLPLIFLASTGVAAGFAGAAIVPLALDAASTLRRIAVAALVGVLVTLALFLLAPYIAPLSALGVGAALLARTGRFDRKNGPAGQH